MRVADRIARALEHAGARVVFTVSGNHVMSVFDALGAYGEVVTSAKELPDALDRAFRCAGPACINVMIEQVPAPVIDRHLKAAAPTKWRRERNGSSK